MTDDSLMDFVTSVAGEAHLKVEENLGDGYVRLRVSEAERRQAKHDVRSVEDVVVELLRNSRDAHSARVFLANSREGDTRTLTAIDDGVGVPPHLHEAVFEPRVTSKLETMVTDRWGVHGRGMALFSVRENVRSARIVSSEAQRGLSLQVVADVATLGERADQSSWPEVERAEDGRLTVVKGPHNVCRRVTEFACEHPGVDVYLGSPAEVLATLYSRARPLLDAKDLLFAEDHGHLALWQRPAASSDASELRAAAAALGLDVSERTAHRVLAGEVAPLRPVLSMLTGSDEAPAESAPDIYRDRRSLRLDAADLAAFKRELERAFDVLGERYYLHIKGEPRVHIGPDEIRVRFHIEKED